MRHANGQGIEAIAVRRAVIADADKVRYRVYRTADDFIAVIAESALMAVKVSGIAEPYRIVRDLPSDGVSLEAERMAKISTPEKISLALEPKASKPEAIEFPEAVRGDFVPMKLRDFEQKSHKKLRILSPAQLDQLQAPSPPPQAPVALVPEFVPSPDPSFTALPEPASVSDEQARESDTLSPEEVAKLLGN